jgi:hypothetical protein
MEMNYRDLPRPACQQFIDTLNPRLRMPRFSTFKKVLFTVVGKSVLPAGQHGPSHPMPQLAKYR